MVNVIHSVNSTLLDQKDVLFDPGTLSLKVEALSFKDVFERIISDVFVQKTSSLKLVSLKLGLKCDVDKCVLAERALVECGVDGRVFRDIDGCILVESGVDVNGCVLVDRGVDERL